MTSADWVQNRIKNLKTKTFSELAKLEPYQDEEILVEEKKQTLIIWKDMIGTKKIQIIININKNMSFKMGFRIMHAEGFIIEIDGSISDLNQETVYEYLA